MNEFLHKLNQKYITPVPHMRATGLEILELSEGRGTMLLPARPDWLGDPARGMLHPGALTVLADSACGLSVGAALQKNLPYATLDLRMDYLRPAGPELPVLCEAECYRLSRSVAFTRASLWQANRDEPIASAQATFMLSTAKGTRPPSPMGVSAPIDAPSAAAAEAAAARWQAPGDSQPLAPEHQVPYVQFLGIQMTPAADATLYRLPYDEKLIGNPRLPALHGGVVAGFAETAATLHLIRHLAGAKFPKSIDFSIDYLRSGRPEETFALSEVVRVGSRVALITTRCWQKSPDYPIAVTRAHFLLTESQDQD